MERHRGDRYGNSPDSHPYRHPRGGGGGGGPPPRSADGSRSPGGYHRGGGFSGGGGGRVQHRGGFDSPPRYPPGGGGGGGGYGDGGGGFRPMGGRGGRGYSSEFEVPLTGQKRFHPDYELPLPAPKREFPFSGRGGSPDHFEGGSYDKKNFDEKKQFDGGSFAKLFVGSVPRTATEEDIRPLFAEHGNVIEVALIKDKRTGQQQGCCFIKYATSEEADRAIRALHNQHTLPGGVGPIQVRYADGERERLVEYKLFVGSINKHATEKEVEDIFIPYGRVEDVYLMRDEMKQSRGCGFVKFANRDMAMAAINALNGIYTMHGCEQPLIVRFADPKRPRPGESRGAPAFGGPGFGPRFPSQGFRPTPNLGEPMSGPIPPDPWRPMNAQDMRPAPDVGMHGLGSQMLPRSGDRTQSSTPAGAYGGLTASGDGSLPGLAVPISSAHQGFIPPLAQLPSIGQKVSPLQKPNQSPQDFPSSLQLQPQTPASYSQAQTSGASVRPLGQLQVPISAGQTSFSQGYPTQQMLGFNGLPLPQPQVQPGVSSGTTQTPISNNFPPHVLSAMANQYQLPGQQQGLQTLHQSPSPLAQLLSQQTQTLQASYQSSQQAFSQLQQQLQLMQPSNQGLTPQQVQAAKMQSSWAASVPQAASTVPASTNKPAADVLPVTSTASVVPVTTAVAPTKCNWTEHTSPDGYKYYYNSTTGESKWEKPEELALLEKQQQSLQQQPQQQLQQQPQQQLQQKQQQQNASLQQPQTQPHAQGLPTQQIPQNPQLHIQGQLQTQFQTQFRQTPQQQQATQSSLYQAPAVAGHQNIQESGYAQFPVGAAPLNDPARFQQGLQATQEWMWKNKPAGS